MKWVAFIYRWSVRLILTAWYYLEKTMKFGAFRHNRVEQVIGGYRPCGNRAKQLLYAHHVKQFHESSCSVASVAAVINALLELNGKKPAHPVTQHELLDKVDAENWKERMSEHGYNGKRGLPLEVLGNVVQASLKAYDISGATVEVVRAGRLNGGQADPAGFEQTLETRLEKFESQGRSFIIAHFDQGSFLPEYHIPHISPIGGFDRQRRTVTMLDVDPSLNYPYRISFETFVKGLSFNYHNMFRPFGYDCGGYVYVKLH